MGNLKLWFSVLCCLITTVAQADAIETIYVEEIGGPYVQEWSAGYLTNTHADVHEIYVKGDGKSGDFFGVLRLDCTTPRFSQWLAVGGFLGDFYSGDAVPDEAITIVRQRYCDG